MNKRKIEPLICPNCKKPLDEIQVETGHWASLFLNKEKSEFGYDFHEEDDGDSEYSLICPRCYARLPFQFDELLYYKQVINPNTVFPYAEHYFLTVKGREEKHYVRISSCGCGLRIEGKKIIYEWCEEHKKLVPEGAREVIELKEEK